MTQNPSLLRLAKDGRTGHVYVVTKYAFNEVANVSDECDVTDDYYLLADFELADMRAERDALAAAVERVRALHVDQYAGCCSECADSLWPCSTIRALDESEANK